MGDLDFGSIDSFDVEVFDSIDFDLLDDCGDFEKFCKSMDFYPLESSPATTDDKTDSETQTGKKRKLGSLKVPEPIIIPSNEPSAVANRNDASPMSAITQTSEDTSTTHQAKVEAKKPVAKKANISSDRDGGGLCSTDIRTKYAEIFVNIMNDFDRVAFTGIEKKYCVDDLLVIYEMVGHNPYGGPNYIEVRGVDAVAQFWENVLSTMPDALFVIHSTKYKVLPNDFMSIVCSFTFQATKVYRMPGIEQYGNDEKVVVSMQQMSVGADGGAAAPGACTRTIPGFGAGAASASTMVVQLPEHDQENSPLRTDVAAAPVRIERSKMCSTDVSVVGTLTFYVNPDKKIYRISFVHSLKPSAGTSGGAVPNKGRK